MVGRLHTSIEEVVAQLHRRIGRRRRSASISESLRRALDDETRWDDIEAGIGVLDGRAHDWDADPAAWVRDQRTAGPRHVDEARLRRDADELARRLEGLSK